MPRYRTIFKKTKYFKKGVIREGNSKYIKKYLARYADEVGKAASKTGESIADRLKGAQENSDQAKWLLPEEATGVLWSGGFFGEDLSPGNKESNKQRGWINRFSEIWKHHGSFP